MQVLRQGDVLLVQVAELPKGAKREKPENGRVILAHGEVTGHAHAIAVKPKAPVAVAWSANAERFLQVMEKTTLRHEEHGVVDLNPGIYHIAIQVEYTPAELRRVQD